MTCLAYPTALLKVSDLDVAATTTLPDYIIINQVDSTSDTGFTTYRITLQQLSNLFFLNGVKFPKVLVANLPTTLCTATKMFVTDALSPVFGSPVVGGGNTLIPVFWDGSNWIVG
jgi:hypothetical protein